MTVDVRAIDAWAGEWAIRELSDPAHASAIQLAELELEAKRVRLVTELAEVDALIIALDDRLGRRRLRQRAVSSATVRPPEARRWQAPRRGSMKRYRGCDCVQPEAVHPAREAERFSYGDQVGTRATRLSGAESSRWRAKSQTVRRAGPCRRVRCRAHSGRLSVSGAA